MPKKTSSAESHFDALFGARQGEQLTNGLKLIPRDKIERGDQPRKSFPSQEIDELAASITALRERGEGIEGTGILQALLVIQNGDSYRLIAGERRYRASAQAGLEQLPAIVTTNKGSDILLAQLVENLQRRDLPPLEEAHGLNQLMSEQKLSLREAARILGKGKGYLENRLNLLKVGTDLQEMVSVRTDSLLQAREIDTVQNADLRAELIRAVVEEGLSHAEVRRRIESSRKEIEDTDTKVSVHTDSTNLKNNSISTSRNSNSTGNEYLNSSNARVDLLQQILTPVDNLLAEAERLLKDLQMTHDYKTMVQDKLKEVKAHIERLQNLAK